MLNYITCQKGHVAFGFGVLCFRQLLPYEKNEYGWKDVSNFENNDPHKYTCHIVEAYSLSIRAKFESKVFLKGFEDTGHYW